MDNKQYTENEIKSFKDNFCPYGYQDMKRAIDIFIEVGLTSDDLFEACEDFCDSTESKLQDLDVCYIAYDYVLQNTRSEIDDLLDFDIQNDIDINIYSNYMCSSFDYSTEDKEELIAKLKDATKEIRNTLFDNNFVSFLFDELEITKEIIEAKKWIKSNTQDLKN